jgi:hypothetical protein
VEDLTAAALLEAGQGGRANAFQAFLTTLAVVVLLLAATAGLVTIVVRGITRPIAMLTRDMGLLAQGDRTVSIDGVERGDEIGAMSRAVQVFKDASRQRPPAGGTQPPRHARPADRGAQPPRLRPAGRKAGGAGGADRAAAGRADDGPRPLQAHQRYPGPFGGDATLCRFVAVAGDVLRAEDVLCRFGGEEFVALLPHAEAAQAVAAAERLRLAFTATGATVSIGVASLRPGETWRTCCVAPTPPCTMPSGPAATAPTCPRRWRGAGGGRSGLISSRGRNRARCASRRCSPSGASRSP